MNASRQCPHRPPCPGCPRLGEKLAGASELAPLQALANVAGLTLAVEEARAPFGYRHRARLAVRGNARAPVIGIFERGSHRAVAIPSCLVQHPHINRAAAALAQAIVRTATRPYADASHRGLLRYAQFVVERASGRVQVVLVANATSVAAVMPLAEALEALLGTDLHSLAISLESRRTNTILGPSCEVIVGSGAVEESIAGARVFFPPDAFGQNNLDDYERIVKQIGEWVPEGSGVTEYYAGVGAIGLSLVPRAASVQFNELAPGSLRGLALGLDALPASERARSHAVAGSADEQSGLYRPSDCVIADPPRRGLDATLRARLAGEPPERFIYLSCGLRSFVDDARELTAGGLELCQLRAYDLFPFTGQVETLALFRRKALT